MASEDDSTRTPGSRPRVSPDSSCVCELGRDSSAKKTNRPLRDVRWSVLRSTTMWTGSPVVNRAFLPQLVPLNHEPST